MTGWDIVRGLCRDAGELLSADSLGHHLTRSRIVEYATREQAQQAVNTLSNQNLMGRLVYVREVFPQNSHCYQCFLQVYSERESSNTNPSPLGSRSGATFHWTTSSPWRLRWRPKPWRFRRWWVRHWRCSSVQWRTSNIRQQRLSFLLLPVINYCAWLTLLA